MPLTSEQARINGAKGGRKLGAVAVERKLQLKELQVMKMRIYRSTRKLIDAQLILATGTHKIITVSFDTDGKKHITTINDIKKIEELLETGIYAQDYFIIEGAKPDGDIANKLLDRAYGKAKETIDLGLDVKFSLKELAKKRDEMFQGKVIDAVATETEKTLQLDDENKSAQ